MNYLDHDQIASNLREELVDIQEIHPTGSSYTCDPPVLDTDVDFVVLVESLGMFTPVATDLLWEVSDPRKEKNKYPNGDFLSFRKENINLIVTDDKKWYDRHVLATTLAKKFNLLEKEDRCSLFEAVLYPDGKPEAAKESPQVTKDTDYWAEMQPLSAERLERIRANLRAIPVEQWMTIPSLDNR